MTRLKKFGLSATVLAGLGCLVFGVVYAYGKNEPRTPDLPQPPLKQIAREKNFELGNHAILNRLREKPYAELLDSQFTFVLADNTPNWYFTDGGLRPGPSTYNFKQMDEVMRFAEDRDLPVQAHHYLWGEEKWLPEWLKNGDYSRDQLYEYIDDHIETVGSKYKGRVREWTVVNEAFTRGQNMYGLHDWWKDATGSQEYIDRAFIAARKADPNSKLILNDFQNEAKNDISDAMYDYASKALKRGVPIDGIGMQMHIDGTHPPVKDEVISNMKRFGELGLDVYVTEFDVNMNDVKAEAGSKDAIAGDIYYDMLRACIESEYCNSFAILGITDRETWYNHLGLPDPRPLPFDREYQPKPAYYSLRRALEDPVETN